MGPGDAYLAGGWPLVAIILASGVILYLVRENAKLRDENKQLTQSSLDLLKRYQDRDQEELRTFREAERRRREGTG
jgi:hypothetical protein